MSWHALGKPHAHPRTPCPPSSAYCGAFPQPSLSLLCGQAFALTTPHAHAPFRTHAHCPSTWPGYDHGGGVAAPARKSTRRRRRAGYVCYLFEYSNAMPPAPSHHAPRATCVCEGSVYSGAPEWFGRRWRGQARGSGDGAKAPGATLRVNSDRCRRPAALPPPSPSHLLTRLAGCIYDVAPTTFSPHRPSHSMSARRLIQ